MDLTELKDFFEYKPIFDEDPKFLVDQIIFLASQYLKTEEVDLIMPTYEFARKAHGEGIRLSGEPYIVHPLKATLFLMDIKPDIASIQTCILHDVIEDTTVDFNDVKKEFGKEVATLCEGLVKVAKVRYSGEERQLETLKKTFLSMGKDLRVIFIKFADRIHNIQTLHYHPKQEKRERIALETMKIYVPIARRLGLYHFQLYLENGAFKVLYPNDFNKVMNYLENRFSIKNRDYTQEGINNLSQLLHDEDIKKFEIKGRLKSPYRIFEKLNAKYDTKELDSVLDILAFRIITDSVASCYATLGIIHSKYTPMIKKIKDYIALPKFNGYQSLHTTVTGFFDFPVEIQIRTNDMDEVSEFGVAAHVGYKEVGNNSKLSERQTDWIKKLQQIVSTYKSIDDKEHFKNELNIELLERAIYIYTPKGDLIELPIGSTLLDFAFRIHSDVGLKFKVGLINGKIKPLSTVLNTGDIVEIETHKSKFTANRHWLDFLHNPSSKQKLNRFLNQNSKDLKVKKAEETLNKKLHDLGLPLLFTTDDKIAKSFSADDLNDMLISGQDKRGYFGQIIRKIYGVQVPAPKSKSLAKKIDSNVIDVLIDGEYISGYQFCPECKPQFPDKIIAKLAVGNIKIHTMSCKALSSVSFDKIINAHWASQDSQIYNLDLEVRRHGNYYDMLEVISLLKDLHVDLVSFRIQSEKNFIVLYIKAGFVNLAKISFVLKQMKLRFNDVKISKKVLS